MRKSALFISLTLYSLNSFSAVNTLAIHNLANNYSLHNITSTTGAEACNNEQKSDPIIKTCTPIKNTSNDTLTITWTVTAPVPDHMTMDITPQSEKIFGNDKVVEEVSAVVLNKMTNKQVFTGQIKNWVGLICDTSHCSDWQ
ncbi:hypothetical protein [Parashewanella tropica]|uniref:hypothetical protein n=1 Tax=Parashewanella tropica TaxID=2547970 RepID=UPI001059AA9E|nr:hypothetical protein [Parashewanella tropica]